MATHYRPLLALPAFALATALVAGLALPASAQSPAGLFPVPGKKPQTKVLPFVQPSEVDDAPTAQPGNPKPVFQQPSELGDGAAPAGPKSPRFTQPSELDDSTSIGAEDAGGVIAPGANPSTTMPPVEGEPLPDEGAQPLDPGAGLPIDPSAGLPPSPALPMPGGPSPVNPGGINPSDLFHPNGGYMQPRDLFHCPTQQCYLKPVTTYVYKTISYQTKVLRYDHCGHPYYSYVTQYKTVKVPVTKYVKVGY